MPAVNITFKRGEKSTGLAAVGDPTFLKGKRTLITLYLKDAKSPGTYLYDWNAR